MHAGDPPHDADFRHAGGFGNSIQDGYVSLGVVTVRSHLPENGWLPTFFDKAGVRAAAMTIITSQSDRISGIVYAIAVYPTAKASTGWRKRAALGASCGRL